MKTRKTPQPSVLCHYAESNDFRPVLIFVDGLTHSRNHLLVCYGMHLCCLDLVVFASKSGAQ